MIPDRSARPALAAPFVSAFGRARPVVAIGAVIAALLCAGVPARAALPGTNAEGEAFVRKAVPSRLAARSLMLDIARAGDRLVGVGERGRVLLSDDAGKTWRQSAAVPVSVTLTAVTFADARHGWATGHAGVVLHTEDAGDTWALQLDGKRAAQLALKAVADLPAGDPAQKAARQLVADGPDKPFLALQFSSPTSGIVVGAYGLIFSTEDAGQTWVPRLTDTDNPNGLHLNAIRTVGGATYIAGEKGLLLRSEEGSPRFAALASPYDGSWFALEALPGGGIVVAGLRGHAYGSVDAGASWQRIDIPSGATLTHAARMPNGTVLFVDQAGAVATLDSSRRLTRLAVPPGAPVTSLVPTGDGSLVAVTLRGPMRLTQDYSSLNQKSASR